MTTATADAPSVTRPAFPLGPVVLAGLMSFWALAVCVLHLALLIIVLNNPDAFAVPAAPGVTAIRPSEHDIMLAFGRWGAPLTLALILTVSAFVSARRRRPLPLFCLAAASVCLAVATTAMSF